MPTFPSHSWMQALADELAAQPGVGRHAAELEGAYRFVVETDDTLERERRYDLVVEQDPQHEHGVAVHAVDIDPARRPRLEIAATHERWVALLRGELSVPRALFLRRLRVRGDLGLLTRRIGDGRPFLDALRRVDSTFAPGRR